MSFDFQLVKQVSIKTKCIVFGYIRSSQSLLPNKSYFNITIDIICNTCLIYYWIREYFSKHGQHIILNPSKDTITWQKNCFQTSYGNIDVFDDGNNYNVYQWKLKILNRNTKLNFYIAIGLESSNKTNTEKIYTNANHSHYAYKSCKLKSNKDSPYVQYGDGFTKGDVIVMECNIKKTSLKFFVNGKDQGYAFENMDFSQQKVYHLAVYGHDKDCKIQLLSFEQI